MSKYLYYFCGLIILSTLITEALFYSQNNLLNNHKWTVSKQTLGMGVMGSDEMVLDRSVLHRNYLDLSKYYGFQEVVTRREFFPKKIKFRGKVPANSHLDIFLEKDTVRQGMRIRSHGSFVFEEKENEGFSYKNNTVNLVKNESWSLFELTLNKEKAFIRVDGGDPAEVEFKGVLQGKLGFRAGAHGSVIDNVSIEGAEGIVFYEDFRRSSGWLNIWCVHFLIILILLELVGFGSKLFLKNPLKFKNYILCQLIICGSILYGFDFYIWSKNSFYNQTVMLLSGQEVPNFKIEKMRFYTFKRWATIFNFGDDDDRKKMVKAGYGGQGVWNGPIVCKEWGCNKYSKEETIKIFNDNKKCKKIIYVGSSQTIGSAAKTLDDTFYSQIQKKFSQNKSLGCVLSLNVAISALRMGEIYSKYEEDFVGLEFDLMLINMGNNDDEESLRNTIPSMIEKNKKRKIKTLFLNEGNALVSEENDLGMLYGRNYIKGLAEQHGIPVLKLFERMRELEAEEVGHLWWDRVHASNFGQKKMAEIIYPEIVKILKEK